MAVTRVAFGDPTHSYKLEGQVFDVDLTFLNGDIPTDPVTFYYRIDNLTTGQQLVGWTLVTTSAASHTLSIPLAASAIETEHRPAEKRRLLISGPGKTVLGYLDWDVENLPNYNISATYPTS